VFVIQHAARGNQRTQSANKPNDGGRGHTPSARCHSPRGCYSQLPSSKRFDTTHSRHKFESVHPSHTHTHTDSLPSISARHLLSGVCLTFTHRFTHWRYRCEKEWGWGEGTTSTRTHSEVDMVFSSHLPHTPTHTSMSSARAQSQLQADNQQQSKGDVPIVLAIPDSQGGAVEGGDPPELHCGLVVVRRVCLVWPKREDVSLNESLLSLILNQSVRTRDDECVMIPA
jgi:hypothetical protein